MAEVPRAFAEAEWDRPQESLDVVRLRGEVNTQFAELRGDLKANLAETNAKIDQVSSEIGRVDDRLGSLRWGFAVAIPVAVALTVLIFAVVQLVWDIRP